mmetsp:Transcript_149342/g.263632  ORF Transcript_149342/g.263632 Transcript_149342/m.263632 type:complete len:337 (+) Transcript_149342:43-1053(+)
MFVRCGNANHRLLVLLVAVVGVVPADTRSLRHQRLNPNPVKEVAKDFAHAADQAAEAVQEVHEDVVQDVEAQDKEERQKMDAIEVFRAMMCWDQDNILTHDKCLKWLTKTCKTETSGEGVCRKLAGKLREECASEDSEHKEVACEFQQELGFDKLPAAKKEGKKKRKGKKKRATEAPPAAAPLAAVPIPAPAPAMKSTEKTEESDAPAPAPAVKKTEDTAAADAAAPVPAPAPKAAEAQAKTEADAESDTAITKEIQGLPSQGYDEVKPNDIVEHKDMETATKDFRKEWPQKDETPNESLERICKKNPDSKWCEIFLKSRREEKSDSGFGNLFGAS